MNVKDKIVVFRDSFDNITFKFESPDLDTVNDVILNSKIINFH